MYFILKCRNDLTANPKLNCSDYRSTTTSPYPGGRGEIRKVRVGKGGGSQSDCMRAQHKSEPGSHTVAVIIMIAGSSISSGGRQNINVLQGLHEPVAVLKDHQSSEAVTNVTNMKNICKYIKIY